MSQRRIEITIPEEMVPFVLLSDGEAQLKRNAMLLYPYIQDGTISHGKAAEILGIHKPDLIVLYIRMGLDYLTESEIDLKKDIETVRMARRKDAVR